MGNLTKGAAPEVPLPILPGENPREIYILPGENPRELLWGMLGVCSLRNNFLVSHKARALLLSSPAPAREELRAQAALEWTKWGWCQLLCEENSSARYSRAQI